MGLIHEFYIVEQEIINSKNITIPQNTKLVSIPDDLILYISDTLNWIDTIWNQNDKRQGLNYYGTSIIDSENIKMLLGIIDSWIILFQCSPNEFYLKGNFDLDKQRFDKNFIEKIKIINKLTSWKDICESALLNRKFLLHWGI